MTQNHDGRKKTLNYSRNLNPAPWYSFQVGHGVFADNDSVGVSCTGLGESFMKVGVARRVGYLVEDKGLSPREVNNWENYKQHVTS